MAHQVPVPEVSVVELKSQIDDGNAPVILDVREPHELRIATLPPTSNSIHIPLAQLPQRLTELQAYKDREIVVYCRSGGRSQMATSLLIQNGFKKVKNLRGGILAWSAEVDPSVATY
jgi:adenylyltransferase/sulfurtransferase